MVLYDVKPFIQLTQYAVFIYTRKSRKKKIQRKEKSKITTTATIIIILIIMTMMTITAVVMMAVVIMHGRSPSAKSTRLVCLWHIAPGTSDNGRLVCREMTLFVLTILWPGNGLFTAEKLDRADIPSLSKTGVICSSMPRLQVSAKIWLGTVAAFILRPLIQSNPECGEWLTPANPW